MLAWGFWGLNASWKEDQGLSVPSITTGPQVLVYLLSGEPSQQLVELCFPQCLPIAARSTCPSSSCLKTFCPFFLNHFCVPGFQVALHSVRVGICWPSSLATLSKNVCSPGLSWGGKRSQTAAGSMKRRCGRGLMLCVCHYWSQWVGLAEGQCLSSKLPSCHSHLLAVKHTLINSAFSGAQCTEGRQLAGDLKFAPETLQPKLQ